ncbi:MAG: hypothetical protein WC719_04010 [Patescibacteria group bacterium]|jgi:alpha-amylase/alpha-mannosidase (GH57 family)
MLWLNFLHFYQPANAESYSIHKALDKSYWRLLRLMEEHPELRATWNVSGCLLERLEDEKETVFLDRLKFLVKKGRIELTGSAAYHGFLPLLPETEVIRQIKTNEKILRKHFGKSFKPAGFFLPEMAYSPALSKLVKRLGYSWIILDEMAYSAATSHHPEAGKVYVDAASGLKVVFRDRAISSAYPPDRIWPMVKEDKIVLTATDAELYGLRHEDPTAEIEKIAKSKDLRTATLSAFIKSVKSRGEKTELRASSWESSPKDVKSDHPYHLWLDKNNKIQANLWKLANLSLALGVKYKNDKNFYWHRWHLVRGLASCTFWWASAHDFSKIYGPYAWSPDEIERGLEDTIRSVRSFADFKTKKKKLEAEACYLKIKKLIWESHWKKHWQKTV